MQEALSTIKQDYITHIIRESEQKYEGFGFESNAIEYDRKGFPVSFWQFKVDTFK